MHSCNLDEVRAWEKKLNSDPKPHFFSVWEKLTKNFGKRNLLSYFEEAYNHLQTLQNEEERFRESFHAGVLTPLKEEKNRTHMKKSVYRNLISLYGKFVSMKQQYGEAISATAQHLSPHLQKHTKIVTTKTQKTVTHTLQEKHASAQDWARGKREELFTRIASYEAALEGLEHQEHEDYKEKIRSLGEKIRVLEEKYHI